METSSFQFTSPQTLSIKADLPCDPRLNTYFLQVMLGALIQHQDLRLLLWQDKLGSPTITPFGLHWDLPEQKHLSLIPLCHFIVSIWQPLLRIHTWPTDHTFLRDWHVWRLPLHRLAAGSLWKPKALQLHIIFFGAIILFNARAHFFLYNIEQKVLKFLF